jgi:hypothetical protein
MRKWLKPALLFGLVGVLHFVLSVAGVVVALPAAFDAQAGFWNLRSRSRWRGRQR